MNSYHQHGSVAVSANVGGSDNVAGFGARRFMQEMYQQQHHHASSSQDSAYHRARAPSYSHAHQQAYPTRDQYADRYLPSQSTSQAYYHQSPSPRQAPLPLPSTSRDAASRDEHTSPRHNHRQLEQHDQQRTQNRHQTQASATNTSSSSRRDAGTSTRWRSGTLESSASDSTAGLAYDRSNDSQYSRDAHLGPSEASTSTRRALVPQIRVAERATIYDDDYEEPLDDSTPATLGDVSSDASYTIVRATVLEPDLPKAKCADCGDSLDFEELANHSCQPTTSSRAPLLTIQVPPSTSGSSLSSTATSPALTTPRSPFFDRYDNLIGGSAPVTPALFHASTQADKSPPDGDDEATPKAHAVRIVGSQAAVKISHFKPSSHPDVVDALPQPVPSSPLEPPPIQRSASDTQAEAAARRKMIEQQRAAKQKDMMASPLPRAATTSNLMKQSTIPEDLSRSKSAKSPPGPFSTSPRVRVLNVSEGQHAKTDSSSSLSSTGTSGSERTRPSRSAALTANITPSSSYELIESDVKKRSTKSSTGSSSSSSKQTRERGGVDLSGIEEMMKDLTESPGPLQRTLTDVPRKSAPRSEAAPSSSLRPRSATVAVKTDRERALELEVERLRDKERLRQLQALRLKEKKKKERAAKRCCVCDCSLASSRTPFVERDGKLLCARDWKELYLPKCRKCNLIVEKSAVKSSDGALRGVFHRSCFSCAACEAPFTDGSFYVFNNQPYCSRHYHRLNGSLCRECESGIEGDCRQTDTGDRFHPHCFSCQHSSTKNGACLAPLADYYVVGGQRLCERHAEKVERRLAKAGQKQLNLRAQKRMTMLHSVR